MVVKKQICCIIIKLVFFFFLFKCIIIKELLQTTAPLYNISDVTLPVALFWAENDWLADPDDVQFLRKNLPNIIYDQFIADWDHLDFIWALDASQVIYSNIINLLKKYN